MRPGINNQVTRAVADNAIDGLSVEVGSPSDHRMVAWAVGPGSQLGQNTGDAQPAPYSLKGRLKPLSIDLFGKTAISFMIGTSEYGCFLWADRMAVCIGVGDSCVDDHVASKSVGGDLREDGVFSLRRIIRLEVRD